MVNVDVVFPAHTDAVPAIAALATIALPEADA